MDTKTLNIFDILLVTGFIFSISVTGLTVYYVSQPPNVMMNGMVLGFKEDNAIMASMLNIGHHFTMLMFGALWGGVFTAYHHLRNTLYGVEIAILSFTMFSFNFVLDVMAILGTGV